MKNIQKFDTFLNEISRDLLDRTTDIMKDRGQNRRANKLQYQYDKKDFAEFIDRPFDDCIISSIYFEDKFRDDTMGTSKIKSQILNIAYCSPRTKEFNRTSGYLQYEPEKDLFTGLPYSISRSDARLLSQIAQKVNPETKYKNSTADFKIKNY